MRAIAGFMFLFVLTGCSDRPTTLCDTCPFYAYEAFVDCEVCEVDRPIEVTIHNNSDEAIVTSICDWTLIQITSPVQADDVHQLDCTSLKPIPIQIEPDESATVLVELDPQALPEFAPSDRFQIRFRLHRPGVAGPAQVYSDVFDLAGN